MLRRSPLRAIALVLLFAACGPEAAAKPADGAQLQARLHAALLAKGSAYVPRTRHKNPDGTPKYTNRLILESSPYLLQHAHNPVQWFAWGNEAFERARTLSRPIFLSVGYSTCHWCHVMEEESFEDEAIAQYINQHYVPIKVDREERPDIDAVYMDFVQAFTGSGGWPMNVWLTAAREPFFGGTYFPPRAGARGAGEGLIEVLREQVARLAADPKAVIEAAHSVVQRLRAAAAAAPAGRFPPASALLAARAQVAQRFDPQFGGMRGAPKFPSSFPLRLMLRVARRVSPVETNAMVVSTLDHMRAGGIYDQVGAGFHRYATDSQWLVPHFEKMLYDNALLALAYLEAAQATGEPRFSAVSRDTLDYLLREMSAPDGTFYAATDADSPNASGVREEGSFFTWTAREFETALGQADAPLAAAWFGVSDAGNFEGRNILTCRRSAEDVARELGLPVRSVLERMPTLRARLLEFRARRTPPLRDDKVIVAWNGLALSAFARAALVLGDARYAAASLRAAQTLVASLRAGRPLPHALIQGREHGDGFADDYILLANALLDVFELTSDTTWLSDARQLMDEVERSFADPNQGGYFLTADRHEQLLLREKPDYDGPIPSANSVAALTWLRLYAFTEDEHFRSRAETTLRAFARALEARPLALEQMLLALDWSTDSVKEIAIVVPEGRGALASAARPLLDVLAHGFVPNAVSVVASQQDLGAELSALIPWARDKALLNGRATAYVCEHAACKLPTNDPATFAAQLAQAKP
jgi:uncharacterized protein YyaL (SSP411 family)